MKDETLSTFSPMEYESLIKSGKEFDRIIKVNLVPINEIISKYFQTLPLDLISIDVEGLEFEILSSLDFELFSPKVFCIEIADYSPTGIGRRRTELIDFLKTKGYYEYANTNLNSIMLRKDFWFE